MASNKTVLVTGSNRGIGLALAEYYTNAGWRVIGTARSGANTDKLKALEPFKIIELEASDEESVKRAAKELEGVKIDLLFNNAGIYDGGRLEDVTKEALLKLFDVNSISPVLVTRALLPNLKLAAEGPDGRATVASVSSLLGSIGFVTGMKPGYAYRASKAALNMLNACIAEDLAEEKITAVVLHPGYVSTDINDHQGTMETSESAAGMASVIAKLKPEDTGKFFDHSGSEWPW